MLKRIKDEESFNAAVERIYELMQKDLDEDSEEFAELDILSLLVQEYEKGRYEMPLPDPIEAIKLRIEEMGMTTKEANEIFGSSSKKSEVFSKKRKLSLSMIRKINSTLGIPTDVLIQSY